MVDLENNNSNQIMTGEFNFDEAHFIDEEIYIPKLNSNYSTPIQEINNNLNNYSKLIKIAHLNAVSLPKHRDEINRIINSTKLDIIGISETNVKKQTPMDVIKIPDYNFFHKNRDHKERGGVGIYVRDNLPARYLHINYEQTQPELVIIEVEINKIKVVIAVMYKSPSTSYKVFSDIYDILAFKTSKYKHIIILGDLNIDHLKTESPAYNFFTSNVNELFCLTQMIKEPTRITKTTSTLIDLILVNAPENVKFSGVVDIPGISDHCLIYMAYAFKKPKFKPKMITRRDFKNFSVNDFKSDMKNAPWANIYAVEENDIDNQVTILENIYSDIIEKHAPFRTFRVTKPPAPWMTNKIKQLMDARDKVKNKFNKDRNPVTFETYKVLKNQVNHEIRKAKITNFNEKINNKITNSKIFHSALKQKNVVNSKQINNETCSLDPNTLNQSFVSNNNEVIDEATVSKEIKKILENSLPEMFEFQEVSKKQVLKAVKHIKSNACGIDNISAYFIKLSIEYSVHAFTDIINAAIKYNYFPARWKKALIKPLPKSLNQILPTDFRPISLLPAFSKIMEKLMAL